MSGSLIGKDALTMAAGSKRPNLRRTDLLGRVPQMALVLAKVRQPSQVLPAQGFGLKRRPKWLWRLLLPVSVWPTAVDQVGLVRMHSVATLARRKVEPLASPSCQKDWMLPVQRQALADHCGLGPEARTEAGAAQKAAPGPGLPPRFRPQFQRLARLPVRVHRLASGPVPLVGTAEAPKVGPRQGLRALLLSP